MSNCVHFSRLYLIIIFTIDGKLPRTLFYWLLQHYFILVWIVSLLEGCYKNYIIHVEYVAQGCIYMPGAYQSMLLSCWKWFSFSVTSIQPIIHIWSSLLYTSPIFPLISAMIDQCGHFILPSSSSRSRVFKICSKEPLDSSFYIFCINDILV